MRALWHRFLWLAAASVCISAVGCGDAVDDLPREPVHGSVTFDGQPLAHGTIQFYPVGDKTPTPGEGTVENGAFSVPGRTGLVPGSYKVMISATTGGTANPGDAPGKELPFPKETIPAKYNTRSAITVEVKAGADNSFAFDLKK